MIVINIKIIVIMIIIFTAGIKIIMILRREARGDLSTL